jgi:hypothetical protein
MNAETKVVDVTLGRETRAITVERFTEQHGWQAVDSAVVVRFPTGRREHVVPAFYVVQRGGQWVVDAVAFRNHNNLRPLRFATEGEYLTYSGGRWTS